jgi:hypothetical protein
MPKRSSHILDLAKRGAEVRFRELKAELASLTKIFPHLRYGVAVSPAMPDAVEEPPLHPRRRRMSAAQRKAVSDRMRKYWAARRRNTR